MNGSTPRRSIDIESNIDDDTSYDSTSQISIDQFNGQLDANGVTGDYTHKFYIESNTLNQNSNDNQATINSLSMLRQQAHGQDLTSFETIKRVLFNTSNYGAGGNNPTQNPVSLIFSNANSSNNSNNNADTTIQLNQLSEDRDSLQSIDQLYDAESSQRIISEFKQKPFEELKNTIYKNSRFEKYQQVIDSLSKEYGQGNQLASSTSAANSSNLIKMNGLRQASRSSIDESIDNLSNIVNGGLETVPTNMATTITTASNTSLSNVSNPSASISSNLYKESHHIKSIPLNDIEFPQLFMY
jgi:hypothetical protein